MSEEVRTNKRRRSESEEPEEEAGDGVGADVVGAGAPSADALDNTRATDNIQGDEADDAAAAVAVTAEPPPPVAPVEQPKMPPMQVPTMQLPVQMTHHQHRVEEKAAVENYYKPEQQAHDTADYPKVPSVMGGTTALNAIPNVAVTAAGMNALQGLGGLPNLAQFGVAGMGLGVGSVDLNQQILAAQQRQYEMNAAIAKAQNNAAAVAAAAAAAARAQPKPVAQPSRKSAPSSYEPPVQLTASGRPARARRVNYAELAGALDDEEEDDQANLVPNWARRRRKTSDQDRDYGVGVGGGARANVQMGGAGNPAMYGVAGAGGFNTAPRAAAPAAGVNLYGLGAQGAAGLRNAVGGAAGAGLQANLAAAGIAGNAALAGQAGWQGQVVWGQNPAMGGYGALQSLAAAQARPQVAAQQFLLPPGSARGVAPNIMQDMQLMLSRGADGQGGMPGAGQQR
ncbi:hypothetical protein Vafri_11978 [Volvox africanus]|uniref:Uncharacterized protein n=1 Tax=Volvox africanus TaxID=51714 RepID=A0A8J4B925_9CHLO|nr:hypothetical protein Vafri_11978 [Volvox africanus]